MAIRSDAVVLVIAAMLLGGCAQVAEGRVRTALVGAGLGERDAACMAERMVDRLSLSQLRRLEALSGRNRGDLARLSLAEYVALARRVGDAEVITVTASSAALCATGLAR